MKSSRAKIHAKFHKIPQIRFSTERRFTSYAGLVVVQALLGSLQLKARLR